MEHRDPLAGSGADGTGAGAAGRTGCDGFAITVAVVEAHEVARRGLHSMVRALPFVSEVDSFASIPAAVRRFGAEWPDVLLVPADLPAAELDALLARRPDHVAVVVLIRGVEPAQLSQAAHIDAQGFVLELDITMPRLESALSQVVQGEIPMPACLARELLGNQRRAGAPARGVVLTAREEQVLELLVEGHSNKEIALALSISSHGAKRHVANVLMKLNCPNRTMAVARAITDGLVNAGLAANA